MIVLEFPVSLSNEQKSLIEHWLKQSRGIYNYALRSLIQWDEFTGYYDQESKKFNPSCPVPWQYRYLRDEKGDVILGDNGKPVCVPFSRIRAEASNWYIKQMKEVNHVVVDADEDKRKNPHGWVSEVYDNGAIASGYSCPIPVRYVEPSLKNWGLKSPGGLGLVIKGNEWKRYAVKHETLSDIPYKLRSGVLTMLETPWQEYIKSRYGQTSVKRGRPMFKKKHEPITTIIHPNPKGVICADGDTLTGIPGLKSVRCRGLSRRWRNPDGSIPDICTFKIITTPNGYRVQLTGEVERSYPVKQTKQAVGIDPGITQYFTTSEGLQTGASRHYAKTQKRREELQQRMDHKQLHRLLLWLHSPGLGYEGVNKIMQISRLDYEICIKDLKKECLSEDEQKHLSRIKPEIISRLKRLFPWIHSSRERLAYIRKNICSLTVKEYDRLLGAKTRARSALKGKDTSTLSKKEYDQLLEAGIYKEMVGAIGNYKFQRLKWYESSNRFNKLKARHIRMERKVGARRKADDEKLTSMIVKNYAFIAVEDMQVANLKRKSKAKVSDDGKAYERNNAAAKSGLSKSLADASPGRKIALLDRKAKRSGRIFEKPTSINGTRECPVCGKLNAPDADRLYCCDGCGWTCDRDISAAVNYELRAFGLNPNAELTAMAEKARQMSLDFFVDKPKAKRPTWQQKSATKKKNDPRSNGEKGSGDSRKTK